ncbi:ferredoxin [Mycobacterium sp. EPa45]|uniref:ferredoxin n=1 Tax=Mycobacterium sp. EPa45 TaxID=1545728 RepID=UPI0006425515|nr:ferredoxin [Mycobacterium sp. EPa45]AKK28726.1 ferredoxin [Mycobacterium sp. EPa45]
MRVEVDSTRCQGHTLCAMIAPESFVLNDVDGHAQAATADIPDVHQSDVREAAISCPEQAINIMVDHVVAARAAHGRPAEH